MRVIALLLCFASRTPPASNAAHSHLAYSCLLSPRALSSMPSSSARDSEHYRGNSRGHTLSVITYSGEIDTPRLSCRGARQPHRNERGHRRGQRSLVSARRRGQRPLERFTVPRAGANGHGYMTKPKSRQAEAFEANGWPNEVAEYDPHGVAAGGMYSECDGCRSRDWFGPNPWSEPGTASHLDFVMGAPAATS